ncbi:hypothetical protein [Haloarchaeobius sp. DYHT-AS-18]|uniref:hypothetical protein n=1 Tax=Haloarchaeobius sp. DYHT-AS-18 TaxID=3446117 RepID=UPI003EB789D1
MAAVGILLAVGVVSYIAVVSPHLQIDDIEPPAELDGEATFAVTVTNGGMQSCDARFTVKFYSRPNHEGELVTRRGTTSTVLSPGERTRFSATVQVPDEAQSALTDVRCTNRYPSLV